MSLGTFLQKGIRTASTKMAIPSHFKLNTGASIPAVGLGAHDDLHLIGVDQLLNRLQEHGKQSQVKSAMRLVMH